MKQHFNLMLLSLFILFSTSFSVLASEEEFLQWQTVEVDCFETEQTGKVHFSAKVDNQKIGSVNIKAFGKSFSLGPSHLKKIQSFPLDGLKITHEAGYKELGGHTVYFKLARTYIDKNQKLQNEKAVVSINKGKGLDVTVLKKQQGG